MTAKLLKGFLVFTLLAAMGAVHPDRTIQANTSALAPIGAKADRPAADKQAKAAEQAATLGERSYELALQEWQQIGEARDFTTTYPASDLVDSSGKPVQMAAPDVSYSGAAALLEEGQELRLTIEVPQDALYQIGFDYLKQGEGLLDPEFSLKVDGAYPFRESRRIAAVSEWASVSDSFETNKQGDELIPRQKQIRSWAHMNVQDPNFLQADALKFRLTKGRHTLTFIGTQGSLFLGKISIKSPETLPDYEQYDREVPADLAQPEIIELEAEKPFSKNSSQIRPIAEQSIDVSPYSSDRLLLNTLGGPSWKQSGQRVTWAFSVPADGRYRLSFKARQDKDSGSAIYRTVEIDGKTPFRELKSYPFPYHKEWKNVTLQDEQGEPFAIFLQAGEHKLTLTADASVMQPAVSELSGIIAGINDLSLSIRKLTGSQTDVNREWEMTEYIPDIEQQFDGFIEGLQGVQERLQSAAGSAKQTSDAAQLNLAIQKLKALRDRPNEVPKRLTELSEGSGSVLQTISDLRVSVQEQPLLLDKIYVHGDVKLPAAQAGFGARFSSSFSEFFSSFTRQTYDPSKTDDQTLEVWVNRSRQYVELMQNMADSTFTPDTGISVKFSVMPNEQKLILANAGNQQPDVALGVSVGTPYELAIRGSAAELSGFADFNSYIKKFSPGAFLPMMIDDKVYALPETQDFYVLFYRKDIFEKLGLEVPNTWEDLLTELPELQRMGLNAYIPLSGAAGNKAFMFTAPFVYQYGGELYAKDGMSTAIDSEPSLQGLRLMTELYTMYSLPLQVPNFYNAFRYGTLPIGISNFETYVQLTSAAPEIAGAWDIALYPGVKQADGQVSRWATGSAQSAMILEKSDKKEQAWELLKWWMSTETQTDYAANLQTFYGTEYMWNTANLEAFRNLPWPREHKEVILNQWKWLKEVPKTPGAYMIEREISNAWNKAVFENRNLRAAIDDSTIVIDREIRRKMEEFGYMENGRVVKPYIVPQLETVEGWMSQNDGDKR
ncbi:hypothetical protein B9G55_21890 [Saccharibacillus sp. O16]|nr:hypothetical protein B9G55_21890 [Saccharibacillus sp. O16]